MDEQHNQKLFIYEKWKKLEKKNIYSARTELRMNAKKSCSKDLNISCCWLLRQPYTELNTFVYHSP